jgi:predicted ATP-grasp superfamily ATP-dependent carboligase
MMRFRLRQYDYRASAYDDQQLIAGFQTQGLAGLVRNHYLVLSRKRRLGHRFTFYLKVKDMRRVNAYERRKIESEEI